VHVGPEIGVQGFQEQMEVIRHQRPGEGAPTAPRRHAVEQFQPLRAVGVVPDGGPPLVT